MPGAGAAGVVGAARAAEGGAATGGSFFFEQADSSTRPMTRSDRRVLTMPLNMPHPLLPHNATQSIGVLIGYSCNNVNFPAIFRSASAGVLLIFAFVPPAARAQTADSAWQTFLMQALYAAGAKDYPKSESLFKEAL